MERKRRRTLALCGCAILALVILVVLSLLAPHGGDFPRGNTSASLEGKMQSDSPGIVLQTDEADPVLLGKGNEIGRAHV